MEFGVMTEPQIGGTYDDILRVARWAEDLGLDVFARSDHWLMPDAEPHATDAFATLAGLARDTSRIELCVLVSPVTFRHPSVIAKTAATIDEMSGGRLALGVGAGWMEAEHDAFGLELWPVRERFERLYETLAYLHAAFGRTEKGFEGRHYHLAPIDVRPAPTGKLPIVVGGSGPRKTPDMAGRFADEFNLPLMAAEDMRARIDTMRSSEAEAGREPGSVKVSAMAPVIAGVNEAEYRDRLGAFAAAHDLEPADLERRYAERGRLLGTYDRVAEGLARLGDLGLDRYYVQMFDPVEAIDTDALTDLITAIRG